MGNLQIHQVNSVIKKVLMEPWLVWLSGLGAALRIKASLVQYPGRAHAWVAGQVPRWGRVRGNFTLMLLSLSFFLPFPLSKNK